MTIKSLFDPSKDIYRTIEKVITYNASQESRLRAEIAEYIVTDHIEDQLEKLLTKMQTAMELGSGNEVGVWVSGFYGSGKSSFTKYLGLALDDRVQVDGTRFLEHLQSRLSRATTRAQLNTLARRYSAAVVMLDLASEMLAGATMEDVSTVLYYKVLQWAGYSRNLKVAALERRLQRDGRYQEFLDRIVQEVNVSWETIKDDPLVVDSVIPEVAHKLYPTLFKTPGAFQTETGDFIRFENERVKEMIEIARQHTGKQHIIFVIDEVGQYVGARPNLILNLDGLAKNLKDIGEGKVWIIGTAQQTLTEDDQKAAFNSLELYKLKDRFPIHVDLESSDIKEICTRRLLGKSPEGERVLGALFDQHGQALRHNTKLQDARFYEADFDRKTFINLYPFLPAHFDILLRLLGEMAKSTGGVGLRSAIKVIQDILVEGPAGRDPIANERVGWLATTVTLYDALEKDIRRAELSIYKAVEKARERYFDSPLHQEVAKTVAVLQILKTMPVTVQNVASLMHPAIDAPARRDAIEAAIQELIADTLVPFGEKDGNLCFFSEKLNEIDQERLQIPTRGIETRRILNEALRTAYSPLPSVQLHGTLAVTTGIKAQVGAQSYGLAGDHNPIQTVVELVDVANYDAARTRLIEESRQRSALQTIFLLARTTPELEEKANEIYRSEQIEQRYRNDPDQEIKEYCRSQLDRANRLRVELEAQLRRLLSQGSFIFHGSPTALETLDQSLLEAAKKYLSEVAAQVFDRYKEAPVRAETALAEKFLKTSNLRAITSAIDPLGLVQVSGGTPHIKSTHKALVSIRDYLSLHGTVDGKRLTDIFTDAPYGWSQDTLRYLVSALLVGGELKLKVSGREVTVNGQQAIEALRTNQAFKTVGVSLRDEKPSNEVLGRAAERLTQVAGEMVIPLEVEISKAAARHFPQFQLRYGSLAEKIEGLGLPGGETVRALNQELMDVLLTDASDAPQRLGGVSSALYERLCWARDVDVALKNGLESTVRELQQHRQAIEAVPNSGEPKALRDALKDTLETVAQRLAHDSFCKHAADLRTTLLIIKAQVSEAVGRMQAAQPDLIREAQQELRALSGWTELKPEEGASILAELDALALSAPADLRGLTQLFNQEFVIQSQAREAKRRVEKLAQERIFEREQEERRRRELEQEVQPDQAVKAISDVPYRVDQPLRVPRRIRTIDSLDDLIRQLEELRSKALYARTNALDVELELEG